jgi:hypothetical protein
VRLSQNPFVFLVNFSRFGGTSLVRFAVKKINHKGHEGYTKFTKRGRIISNNQFSGAPFYKKKRLSQKNTFETAPVG